jgi:hypothetical protein
MEVIMPSDEPPETVPSKQSLNEKRWLLFVYVPVFTTFLVTMSVIFEQDQGLTSLVNVLLTLGLNIFAFVWCRIDGRERNYKFHQLFPVAVIILGLVAVLYYLFRSRGFSGGLVSTGWLLLYMAACFVMVTIVGVIMLIVLASTGVISPEIFAE